jgi:hypothetical protein
VVLLGGLVFGFCLQGGIGMLRAVDNLVKDGVSVMFAGAGQGVSYGR